MDHREQDRPQEENTVTVGIRDYFAAAALTGILACPTTVKWGVEEAAQIAYHFADAMLKARLQ